jgi:transcriptional regulator with XRE-family HTH domain
LVATIRKEHQTFAERIKALRGYLSMTRKEFCSKHGIPEPTLRAWELSLYSISPTHLQKLIKAFERENILCTTDWLLHGEGTPPLFAVETINRELEKVTDDMSGNPSLVSPVLVESAVFGRYNPGSFVMQVSDNSMLPQFERGDYVGGIKQDLSLKPADFGKIYIVILEDGSQVVRIVYQGDTEKTFTLGCLNLLNQQKNPIMSEIKPKELYQVVWHRKN